jgi:glycosyltransferase involved in cell wall biosynthesis
LNQTKSAAPPVVLIFLPCYLPGYKSGGPIRTIANLIDQLGENFQFKIFTSDRDRLDKQPYKGVRVNEWNRVGKAMVYYCSPGNLSLYTIYKILSRTQYDILYLNSFFSPKFTVTPLLLRRLKLVPRKPTILAPRGELATPALKLKAWKKKPYMFAARSLDLYFSITWHASTLNEKNEIINNMVRVRRVMIAEQINIAENLPAAHGDLPESAVSKQPGRLNIIFLSRICRMKNLGMTLDVLRNVKGRRISFHIYGPVIDPDYWQQCEQMFHHLPEYVTAEYRGVVKNAEVIEVIGKYDLFFLPSLGENFGHAIWEAMAAGRPVLISDRTPWCGLRELGVGWDLPLSDPGSFREIIEHCADMDQEEFLPWSTRARNYALSKMNNTETVERNINLFRAALLNGDYAG